MAYIPSKVITGTSAVTCTDAGVTVLTFDATNWGAKTFSCKNTGVVNSVTLVLYGGDGTNWAQIGTGVIAAAGEVQDMRTSSQYEQYRVVGTTGAGVTTTVTWKIYVRREG